MNSDKVFHLKKSILSPERSLFFCIAKRSLLNPCCTGFLTYSSSSHSYVALFSFVIAFYDDEYQTRNFFTIIEVPSCGFEDAVILAKRTFDELLHST